MAPHRSLTFSEEERKIDPHLGYPRAFAKLCRNSSAWIQLKGFALPYGEGPPRTFFPYSPDSENFSKLEQVQDLFPVTVDSNPVPATLQKFRDILWQQLDHLGNAGFDPACFRVDGYGNVLYWHADPSSPLAWEVCHWFPYSRGGKTVLNNLRIVHWQVCVKKKEKLEFLIPWWEFQLGVSISQFLSAFESPNIGFRQRCLSYFFLGGEEEMPDGKRCVGDHQWPHSLTEKQKKHGFAVAGFVRLQKNDDVLKAISLNSRSSQNVQQDGWTALEEDALLRGYQQFGFGNWKAIKESDSLLSNRTLVQIRDKYRSLVGLEKENNHSPYGSSPLHQNKSPEHVNMPEYIGHLHVDRLLSSLKRESKIKLLRDEEKQMRGDESAKLQQTLQSVKQQNEQEKAALDALEAQLRKQRRQVEKQRQWNETQIQYRLCLERMIHEAMHQSVVYKEESRLTEIACNTLRAQLESQTETCNAAEHRYLEHVSKRQGLIEMAKPVPLLENGTATEAPENHAKKEQAVVVRTQRNELQGAKDDRPALQVRDLQNHPTDQPLAKPECSTLSDSEEHQRSLKRFKKTTPTPAKRSQSAPRQRLSNKENIQDSTVPTSAKKLDKLYYEGNKSSRLKSGESRRTAGHGTSFKVTNANESLENSSNEMNKAEDEVDDRTPSIESDGGEKFARRTFKLMPVVKREIENPDATGESQRFKCILHAPQSRESSERFELDVSTIDTAAKAPATRSRMTQKPTRAKPSEGGELPYDEESLKEGKATLDKWIQSLLMSTEPTLETEVQEDVPDIKPELPTAEGPVDEVRRWPEDIGVPPPGLPRGLSLKVSEEKAHVQNKKSSSDKLKVPFSGLLRRLSSRHHHSKGEAAEAELKEPPRRQVTFEDWEGITDRLAAMRLDNGNPKGKELRSTSLRASTGSFSSMKNRSPVVSLDPSPPQPKVTKSLLYYSTESYRNGAKANQAVSNAKRMSRRASIDECAQAWKKEVSRLESKQVK